MLRCGCGEAIQRFLRRRCARRSRSPARANGQIWSKPWMGSRWRGKAVAGPVPCGRSRLQRACAYGGRARFRPTDWLPGGAELLVSPTESSGGPLAPDAPEDRGCQPGCVPIACDGWLVTVVPAVSEHDRGPHVGRRGHGGDDLFGSSPDGFRMSRRHGPRVERSCMDRLLVGDQGSGSRCSRTVPAGTPSGQCGTTSPARLSTDFTHHGRSGSAMIGYGGQPALSYSVGNC
jgi:hypothetical protein